MNVKIVKLINGEEIIAKILPSSGLIVKIENPVRIVVMPNKLDPKTPNVGLAPWAEFSDEKVFELDKSHVLCIMTPVKEFVNQYNSIFGGLVLPNSGLLK
jgi:hypothetical protein